MRSSRALGGLYVLLGLIGLGASLGLYLEKLATMANPLHRPSCDVNPVISCGSVMSTPQAELLGFPNPILGIVGFPVVIAVGIALLARWHPPTWFGLGFLLGTTAGVALVHWLIYQSLANIKALCPYCMVVWAVTIPIFWYTLLAFDQHSPADASPEDTARIGSSARAAAQSGVVGAGNSRYTKPRTDLRYVGRVAIASLGQFHTLILALWYIAILVSVLVTFWQYWSQLF